MKASEVRKALERAGLSRYEALVFLNLARLGAATAREVARASGVNRVQTYRALDGLEGRGLVEVTLDRPRRYAAREIEEVLDMITEERRNELEGLEGLRQALVKAWPKTAGPKGRPDVRLQVIKGRAQVYRAIRRLVGAAKSEVLAFTTTKGLQRSYREGINELLVTAIRRGVKARLLVDVTEANAALIARVAEHVPLRHMDHQRGRFILVDHESILAFLVQDEGTIRGDAETALWTNSLDFVEVYRSLFETAWLSAMPADRRLAAVLKRSARAAG